MGTYIITGGATGIGAAVRERLTGEGHQVIVIDLKDADINADLSTAEGVATACDAMRESAPDGLDGFVPCAGVGPHLPPLTVARLNYFGAIATTRAALPLLEKKQAPAVLISSNSAPMTNSRDDKLAAAFLDDDEEGVAKMMEDYKDGTAVYATGKYALGCWMRRNCAEWAKRGVRMNAVAPGMTITPLVEANRQDPRFKELMDEFEDHIPIQRAGQPEEIAAVICFLLGPEASFCCGSVFFIDGGTDTLLRPDIF